MGLISTNDSVNETKEKLNNNVEDVSVYTSYFLFMTLEKMRL